MALTNAELIERARNGEVIGNGRRQIELLVAELTVVSKKVGKLSRDGLPVDPMEWTTEDWSDLYKALEKVKNAIRKRHSAKGDAQSKPRAKRGVLE